MKWASLLIAAAALAGCGGPFSSSPPSAADAPQTATVSSADRIASAHAAGRLHLLRRSQSARAKPAPQAYAEDVTYFGGALLKTAVSHDVYVNCASTCWGDPQGFLDRLDNSAYVHVADQYIGLRENARYVTGPNVAINETLPSRTVTTPQIYAMLHAAAAHFGGGYHNVYHVFFPQGYDVCASLDQCYSPDNYNTWTFCAYHGSTTFADAIGHVVFTVEPYQDVVGCAELGMTPPNNYLIDSTDSTLLHEFFETITDPDPDSGWYNPYYQDEIADLCQGVRSVVAIDGHNYEVQDVYSNAAHTCVN